MLEYYLDKGNEHSFYKLLEIRDLVTNRSSNSIVLIRSNGFFASNSLLAPSEINVYESDG